MRSKEQGPAADPGALVREGRPDPRRQVTVPPPLESPADRLDGVAWVGELGRLASYPRNSFAGTLFRDAGHSCEPAEAIAPQARNPSLRGWVLLADLDDAAGLGHVSNVARHPVL